MYKLKNVIFFVLYIITRPYLIFLLVSRKLYLPVYVQFEWLKKYKNIKTIIDVGAHEGKVSKVLNAIYPNAEIFAFEPNTKLHNLIKNNVRNKNIHIEPVAISNKIGKTNFYFSKTSTLSSIMELKEKNIREGVKIKINKTITTTTTLDHYFRNDKKVDNILLKIDTEGAEGKVLEGADKLLNRVLIIHIETYYKEIYSGQHLFDDIYTFLKKRGFVYIGDVHEAYFYPMFKIQNISNSVFINKKLWEEK